MSEHPGIAWLRQQITGRLETARLKTLQRHNPWHVSEMPEMFGSEIRDQNEILIAVALGSCTATYIATNDPRQIIADCEAQLAILDRHASVIAGYGPLEDQPACRCCSPEEDMWYATASPCGTVWDLASAYRHKPGFTEHWGSSG